MDVTIDQLMEQVNADDEDKLVLQIYLTNAKAAVKQQINRPMTDLNDNELSIFNQIVLEMATSFYLNRDGAGKGVTKSFSGLNSLIDTIRKPALGSGSDE